MIAGAPKQSLKKAFEKYVVRKKGCWGWDGFSNPYPQFMASKIRYRGHRASWIIHFGNIPEGKHVCHKCDNPRCTNPDHLFLGSHKDNMQDAKKKGRNYINRSGENTSNAKLTNLQVKNIKFLLEQKLTIGKLGKMFNVHWSTISKIKTKKSWDHISA